MAKRNPSYDFKWCPGCGDFGVKRAIEMALTARASEKQEPIENSVIVAGIGCSGNLVHLQEGPQPFGIHGIHGRTLPIAYGTKSANPDLNVLVVTGDGDFLSIGGEHIGPQARRNLDITVVVMDNGIYGLTKGQASPTTDLNEVTPTTKYGKLDDRMNPLMVYLGGGARFVISELSTRIRPLQQAIEDAMNYPGFSIVHVQSPCTTYNDTYAALKGDEENGIKPLAQPIPDSHDASDYFQALALAAQPGVPVGVLYRADDTVPAHDRLTEAKQEAGIADTDIEKLFDGMVI